MGGSAEDRMSADEALQACVKSVGKPGIAALMLAGGSPWCPTTFRWGYGWPYTHCYSMLTHEELEQVRKKKQEQGLN